MVSCTVHMMNFFPPEFLRLTRFYVCSDQSQTHVLSTVHLPVPFIIFFLNLSSSFNLFYSACYSTVFVRDVFVLLACDGVYDVMENQEIVDILSYKLGCTGLI